MENNNKYLIQATSIILLVYGIFSIGKDDLANRFSIIVIAFLLTSFLIEDKRVRNIHRVAGILIFVMIWILGYGFDYFHSL